MFVETHSEDETINAGIAFSGRLKPGDIVACYGELGSGKTHFIKGICKGLGIKGNVTSPSFTIVNEYFFKNMKVYHFDFYRISSIEEVEEIGFEEYISGDGIYLIEWADRIKKYLTFNRFDIYLGFGGSEYTRSIEIREIIGIPA